MHLSEIVEKVGGFMIFSLKICEKRKTQTGAHRHGMKRIPTANDTRVKAAARSD